MAICCITRPGDMPESLRGLRGIPRIGEMVKVINPGQVYHSYSEAARQLGADKWVPRPLSYIGLRENDFVKVKGIRTETHNHPYSPNERKILLLVSNGAEDFIIGIEGIEGIEVFSKDAAVDAEFIPENEIEYTCIKDWW